MDTTWGLGSPPVGEVTIGKPRLQPFPRLDGLPSALSSTPRIRQVNGAETELEALRQSVMCGSPFGGASWPERTAQRLGREAALRRQGLPK